MQCAATTVVVCPSRGGWVASLAPGMRCVGEDMCVLLALFVYCMLFIPFASSLLAVLVCSMLFILFVSSLLAVVVYCILFISFVSSLQTGMCFVS